jgi:hypothetical protein
VDHAHAEPLREARPAIAIARGRRARPGQIEQRLLDEERHQTRVRPERDQRSRVGCLRVAQREHRFAQRVVRALRGRQRAIGVGVRPGLGRGVDVQRAALAAQLDQGLAADVHRQVDEHVAGIQARAEQRPVVRAIGLGGDVPRAVLARRLQAALRRLDDLDAIGAHRDVAQQQRQHGLADAAETEHHDAAVEGDVCARFEHAVSRQSGCPR